jgi:hypothetical protein
MERRRKGEVGKRLRFFGSSPISLSKEVKDGNVGWKRKKSKDMLWV